MINRSTPNRTSHNRHNTTNSAVRCQPLKLEIKNAITLKKLQMKKGKINDS